MGRLLHALEVEEDEEQEVEADGDEQTASGGAEVLAADLEDPRLDEGEEGEVALVKRSYEHEDGRDGDVVDERDAAVRSSSGH